MPMGTRCRAPYTLLPQRGRGAGGELIGVHRFGTESLRQGRFSPRGREQVGAPFCPHPLCPPLPRGGRGGKPVAGRTAVHPYTPLPRGGRGGTAGRTAVRPTPLSHAVGEGLGVRAKSGRALYTANPSNVPLSDLQEGAVVNSVRAIGIIPIAEPKFVNASVSNPPSPRPSPPLSRLKGVGFFREHGNLPLKSTKKTYPHTNQHKNNHHQAPLAAVHNHHTYPKPTHNTPIHDQHHTHPPLTTRLRTPKTPTNRAPSHRRRTLTQPILTDQPP